MPDRSCQLSPPDLHRLDWACTPIALAFDSPPYLVGSTLARPDFRDIDLRLILPNKRFKRMFPSEAARLLLSIAVSDLIAAAAKAPAPIDFQFQSASEAAAECGPRNPMGVRLRIQYEAVDGGEDSR